MELTESEKKKLFWASFLSLTAAGFGFAFRVAHGGSYGEELNLTNLQVGQLFGATLWPLAITMILFSLIVDKTGYKIPMYIAFGLQVIAGLGTAMANSYGTMYFTALCAGLAHGIIEAVINPACAAVYPKEKTKWLTYLHAAWPGGLAGGMIVILLSDGITGGLSWRVHAMWILLPAIAYAILYAPVRFPVDERVRAGVPYKDMLREVGFLGSALASFMLVFEIGNLIFNLSGAQIDGRTWFYSSIVIGLVIGAIFGGSLKALGKPIFFLMCLLMIPLATAELATDQWIKKLMTPVLENMNMDAGFALVFSAAIMTFFRVFAGGILKFFTPPALLTISGVFSAVGLFWLSSAGGAAVFIAFTIYALGQTYYWPCVLGFVSEQYPKGGALTLNTVSALGMLSVGIIGGQLMGAAFDRTVHEKVTTQMPALAQEAEFKKDFLWTSADAINPEKRKAYLEMNPEDADAYAKIDRAAGRDVLVYSVRFPAILILGFGLVTLYFRSKGGYKPVELQYKDEEMTS